MVTESLYNNKVQSIEIEIDWEEYFKEFCRAHGNYPVIYNDNELLFPDGWRYSSYAYEGPESPPPKDKQELAYLLLFYWQRRYKIVKQEYDGLEFSIAQLKEIERSRDRPLYQRVTQLDDDNRQRVISQRLDFDALDRRLQWLKHDKDRCLKEIERIKLDAMRMR